MTDSREEERDIIRKVLLLSLLRREESQTPDSIDSVLSELDEVGAIKLKEGRELLKELKGENLFSNGVLTPLGIVEAEVAKNYFKI